MTDALTLDELDARGEELGRALRAGELLTFEGELGAGKTTFIKAVARGLGVTAPATSPTYCTGSSVSRAARASVPSGLLPPAFSGGGR